MTNRGVEKLAQRHTDLVLAVHKALALLNMYLIDSRRAPTAVEEAARELEAAAVPLRLAPTHRASNETEAEFAALQQREWRRLHPEKAEALHKQRKREAKIERRMKRGMTREQAEAHADSGAHLNARIGDDYDALLDIDIPTVDVRDL